MKADGRMTETAERALKAPALSPASVARLSPLMISVSGKCVICWTGKMQRLIFSVSADG
jgi:hypothetical protein